MRILQLFRDLWTESDGKAKVSFFIILMWTIVALLAPFLASSEPIVGSLPALVGYDYDQLLGGGCSLVPPLHDCGDRIHWLGTDSLGRDVAGGMIHGARVSFLICLIVIASALFVGLLVGMLMGFFGDDGVTANIPQMVWGSVVMLFLTYYKVDILSYGFSLWSFAMLFVGAALLIVGVIFLGRLPLVKYGLPLDAIWQRVFEVKESLPNLFLLLAIAAIIAEPSILTLSLTMVLLYWVTFARYARIEMMRVKEEDYMMAAKAEGLSTWLLLKRHALPNIISPLLVVVAFSISGVILLESSLSFLGVGLPLEEVTWGKLLAEARKSSEAWWLAVFPGIAIFLLVFAFNTVADVFRESTNW